MAIHEESEQNYQVFETKGCACDDCGGVAWVEEELGLGLVGLWHFFHYEVLQLVLVSNVGCK